MVSAMRVFTIAVLLVVLLAQSSRDLRALDGQATQQPNAQAFAPVIASFKHAVNGKTFHVHGLANTGGFEQSIQMDAGARPRFILTNDANRAFVFDDFTGLPAMTCDGKPLNDTLVIEYGQHAGDQEWTAEAYSRRDVQVIKPFWEMLDAVDHLAGPQVVSGRRVLGLVAPWKLSTDPQLWSHKPVQQTLWIDNELFLPLRWEMTDEGKSLDYGYSFEYDGAVVLTPPAAATVPTCVQ